MKSFFKKLAFVMALAMVVSMVAPAGSALAATTGVSLQGTKTIVETYELEKAGATVDFSFQGAPKDWKSTFKWTSSDAAVAAVDQNGLVTAVAAGTATITITAGADASYVETVVVTVKAEKKGAFEVAQVNTNTVTLTFDKAPKKEELEAGLAFNLVIAGVPVTLPVNTVKVKDNVATVSVFNTFVDGEEYSFAYGDDTVAFTASVGEIDHVEFAYYTLKDEDVTNPMWSIAYVNDDEADFETILVPTIYDANNIDITAKYDLDDDLEITYELVNENDDIELDEDEGTVSFDAVAAAAITMTVLWEDKDAEEYTKTFTGVVVAEKLPEIALEYAKSGFVKMSDFGGVTYGDEFDYEDAMEDFTTNRWSSFWNGGVALKNSMTLPQGDDRYQFAALFNTNRGDQVVTGGDVYGEFSFESSNDDVLSIDEEGELSFYEAGSAYVLVYFTPDTDDDDAKPVFVGSQKLTVGPARYATSFKVLNTSASAGTDELRLYGWQAEAANFETYNYNKATFDVQVIDQTGAVMWTNAFLDLFEVEAIKEENEFPLHAITYKDGVYTVAFDGDEFALEDDKDYQKFKYELTIDKTADISKKITTKGTTLTVKIEDNAKDRNELAKFLIDNADGVYGLTVPAGTVAADEFDIVGLKGGYGIDLNIKQSENWQAIPGYTGTPKSVKLGWANNIAYVDGNGAKLANVPASLIIEKGKATTGDAGMVYYTITAPAETITYDDDKLVATTVNWNVMPVDGGVVFQWNNDTINPDNYYNQVATFEAYAKTGEYTVTFWTAKKDGGKLYEKGSYTFNVGNSQTLPTFNGFNPDYDNHTEITISRANADAIVKQHLVFYFNGWKLDSAADWTAKGLSIDWDKSDFHVTPGEKLRVKKLCIVAPIDADPAIEGDTLPTFESYVTVGKNIYAEED